MGDAIRDREHRRNGKELVLPLVGTATKRCGGGERRVLWGPIINNVEDGCGRAQNEVGAFAPRQNVHVVGLREDSKPGVNDDRINTGGVEGYADLHSSKLYPVIE
jgi:hypothetical protein